MKNVIITGIGQDGYYLSKKLLDKGYFVVGLDQWQSQGYNKHLKELMSNKNFKFIEGDITDRYLIRDILTKYQPELFFNTAAISHVAVSFNIPEKVAEVNYLAVVMILNEIKAISPSTRFLQCSTSEQFGDNIDTPQNENSNMMPNSPYAVAKMGAFYITKIYRKYGLKTYNSLAFNHESPLRPDTFVTKKIIKALVNISKGSKTPLVLGNINSNRDWGYAPEYVDAMIKIINSDIPDDYVICTSETHSIREFIEESCNQLDMTLKWEGEGLEEVGYIDNKPLIFISKDFYRPNEVSNLLGDYSKLKNTLGWEPKVKFAELINIMIDYEVQNND